MPRAKVGIQDLYSLGAQNGLRPNVSLNSASLRGSVAHHFSRADCCVESCAGVIRLKNLTSNRQIEFTCIHS